MNRLSDQIAALSRLSKHGRVSRDLDLYLFQRFLHVPHQHLLGSSG
jgi:hypothetical protein